MTSQADVRFVILTALRSGSTWLVDLLNSLDGVAAYGELFTAQKRDFVAGATDYPEFIEFRKDSHLVRPFSVFSFLDGLYRRPGAVGFKLLYAHLRWYPETLAYLCRHRVRVVHLVRQNHLDVLVSAELVAATGVWHLTERRDDEGAVYLDPDTLLWKMRRLRRNIVTTRRLLRWSGLPHIEISYEELVGSPAAFEAIDDFLGVGLSSGLARSRLVKIRKGGQRDLIRNYDQVARILSDSEFAGFLT